MVEKVSIFSVFRSMSSIVLYLRWLGLCPMCHAESEQPLMALMVAAMPWVFTAFSMSLIRCSVSCGFFLVSWWCVCR